MKKLGLVLIIIALVIPSSFEIVMADCPAKPGYPIWVTQAPYSGITFAWGHYVSETCSTPISNYASVSCLENDQSHGTCWELSENRDEIITYSNNTATHGGDYYIYDFICVLE